MQDMSDLKLTCSRCFAFDFDNSGKFGRGTCLVFTRPTSRRHDEWPKVTAIDAPCESFKPGDGTRPRVLTLANYPASAIETCKPGPEPEKKISVSQFLVSLDSQAKPNKKPPDGPQPTAPTALSVTQAAKSLGVTAATLTYHIGKAHLKVKQTGHGPVIYPADLDEFVRRWRRNRRQHVFEPTAQGG
ncbi:MAG: hypothetical protein HQK57_03935 [Deltaproteobacteria bacterium]|nr:hypothetical protein [Deltaproteobacteria bacterium]